MPIPDVIQYNAVHFVESLRPRDLETGQQCYHHLRSILADRPRPPSVEYHRAYTETTFRDSLARIVAASTHEAHTPIVQIDAHGDRGGIQLGCGTYLPWSVLTEPLGAINTSTGCRTLVILAACSGINLIGTLMPHQRAPFAGMLGPSRRIDEEVLLASLKSFYSELWCGRGDVAAFAVLNDALREHDVAFLFHSAKDVFHYLYHYYLRLKATPRAIQHRAMKEALMARLFEMSTEPADVLMQRVALFLSAHEWHFLRYKAHFFMFDQFPSNRDRFPLAFSDVEKSAGPLGRFGSPNRAG